nr:hypothetical protein [Delftia acidovorans]
MSLKAWRSASEPPARLCAVMIPIECSELKKQENGVGWRRIRQRRQSKNQIRSMTNVENQAPASMWRMSVAPMMDWIDS